MNHQPVPNEQNGKSAQRCGDETRALIGPIPPDRLTNKGSQECAEDPKRHRQDKACRLIGARRKYAGKNAGDKANHDNPDYR